jgi:hypothetical protein
MKKIDLLTEISEACKKNPTCNNCDYHIDGISCFFSDIPQKWRIYKLENDKKGKGNG